MSSVSDIATPFTGEEYAVIKAWSPDSMQIANVLMAAFLVWSRLATSEGIVFAPQRLS
jgi:hypothetical protein